MNYTDGQHGGSERGSILPYAIGFFLSLALTFAAFWAAFTLGMYAPLAIIVFAIAQLLVQLVCFLHLGRRGASDDRSVFAFTLIIIGILVGGTLWIMQNLAHLHVHEPTPTELYQGGMVAPANELH